MALGILSGRGMLCTPFTDHLRFVVRGHCTADACMRRLHRAQLRRHRLSMKMLLLFIFATLVYEAPALCQLEDIVRLSLPDESGCDIDKSQFYVLKRESFTNFPKVSRIDFDGFVEEVQPFCFSKATSLDHVNLRKGNISHIKNDVFTNLNLSVVQLIANRINRIDDRAFARMPRLYTLDLSHNKIEYVDKSWFDGSSIEYLWLDNNLITQLRADAFSTISKGVYLFIGKNKISSIENEALDTFRKVYLDSNFLSEVSFVDNARLDFLTVADNRIKYIRFTRYTNIHKIDVQNNTWICDCFINFYKAAWYKNTTIEGISATEPVCNATIERCPYHISNMMFSSSVKRAIDGGTCLAACREAQVSERSSLEAKRPNTARPAETCSNLSYYTRWRSKVKPRKPASETVMQHH